MLCGCTTITTTTAGTSSTTKATSSSSTATSETTTAETTLANVTLIGYLFGSTPIDGPAVVREINKKLLAEINAQIELNYIAYGDISTKFPLVLTTLDTFDFIIAHDYQVYASKGAFREITMEEVDKYLPLTDAVASETTWQDALINGKLYLIPQTFKELDCPAIFYRMDLAKKYGINTINSMDDLKKFMQSVKVNEKAMIPLDGDAAEISWYLNCYMQMSSGYGSFGKGGDSKYYFASYYNVDDPTYKMLGFFDEDYLVDFRKAAAWMKSLYDEGLMPKDAFARQQSSAPIWDAGKCALTSGQFESYPGILSEAKAKGWEVGCLPVLSPNGHCTIRPSTANGIAISAASKYPERVMMAIDRITQDKAYNFLASFGIEGRNYFINADGKLDLAPGVDPANNPYPLYAAGWWSTNRDMWPPMVSESQEYLDAKGDLKQRVMPYLLQGFNPNFDGVKTENANCNNVIIQYCLPIKLGMVDDIDAAIAELQQQLDVAGYKKVQEAIKGQANDYISSHQIP
jgi:putative aldouronate transport system substrate-binding protein